MLILDTAYPCHQIIDENQKFSNELSNVIRHQWGLSKAKLNYHVVSIFGSQSTGKSTLLNGLFETSFDVMDAKLGRQQTTRGIWMPRAKRLPIIVMDIEGCDGAERGEDQDFERKAALFALTTSEVVIFNLFENQVNLYAGGNMNTLKTVIQVNLELFQNQKGTRRQKTLILVVIRDYSGQTSIEKLKENLKRSFDNIWKDLNKPNCLGHLCDKNTTTNATIDDFFDFMFIGLPHAILSPEQFTKEVANFQQRFIDQTHSDYVFRPQYHRRIPVDGYHNYVSDIWKQICINKDLDLPTQQELLAEFRCNEILNIALEQFGRTINPLKTCTLERGEIISDLGYRMRTIRCSAINEYHTNASSYHPKIYQEKSKDLLEKLNGRLRIFFVGQLKNLHIKAIQMFEFELKITNIAIFNNSSQTKKVDYDAEKIIASRRKTIEQYFLTYAQEILLPDTNWCYQDEYSQLRITLDMLSKNALLYDFERFSDYCKIKEEYFIKNRNKWLSVALTAFATAAALNSNPLTAAAAAFLAGRIL